MRHQWTWIESKGYGVMGTRGTYWKIKKDEQVPTPNVQIQMCGSLENKQEELKPLMLLVQHCWNNRYGGNAHMWWKHCEGWIQAPQERQGRKKGSLGGALHMKDQPEHLWWMVVWLDCVSGSEKKPLRATRMWQCITGQPIRVMRAVKHWNRLSGNVVQSPSFEFFKAWLDKAPRNLVWSHSWYCLRRQLD